MLFYGWGDFRVKSYLMIEEVSTANVMLWLRGLPHEIVSGIRGASSCRETKVSAAPEDCITRRGSPFPIFRK